MDTTDTFRGNSRKIYLQLPGQKTYIVLNDLLQFLQSFRDTGDILCLDHQSLDRMRMMTVHCTYSGWLVFIVTPLHSGVIVRTLPRMRSGYVRALLPAALAALEHCTQPLISP